MGLLAAPPPNPRTVVSVAENALITSLGFHSLQVLLFFDVSDGIVKGLEVGQNTTYLSNPYKSSPKVETPPIVCPSGRATKEPSSQASYADTAIEIKIRFLKKEKIYPSYICKERNSDSQVSSGLGEHFHVIRKADWKSFDCFECFIFYLYSQHASF